MTHLINLLKVYRWGALSVCALCVVLVTATTPRRAEAQGLVEYALAQVLTAVVVIAVTTDPIHPGAEVAGNRLASSFDDASAALEDGDQAGAIRGLRKSLAAAKSLLGIYASCGTEECEAIRSVLQSLVGILSTHLALATGLSPYCVPDGIIRPFEQCDPQATPTGCASPSFCNEACLCGP